MSENKNTEVQVTTGFAAVTAGAIGGDMDDECQGLSFTFDRVKLPSGGGTVFEMPGDDESGGEIVKDITGVIVYNHPAYAYYHDKYTGGSNPPDCGSFDGIEGIGTPGGMCADCPNNRYGSGEGQSKLCKNKRILYILIEGEIFPITLTLPTGSLKNFTNYVKSQLSKGRKLSHVVTKITLKKATNKSGIDFSQAVFTFVRMLSPDERLAVGNVTASVKEYSQNLTMASMVEEEADFAPENGVKPLN